MGDNLDLEKYILPETERQGVPKQCLDSYNADVEDRVPSAIGKHPELGWFHIWSAGQGPALGWAEWWPQDTKDKIQDYLDKRTNQKDNSGRV